MVVLRSHDRDHQGLRYVGPHSARRCKHLKFGHLQENDQVPVTKVTWEVLNGFPDVIDSVAIVQFHVN